MTVQLIDHMGDDLTVVNAARVSMHKESTSLNEADKKLIHYLAKHNHWTPFAHVTFQFRIKMPIFVAREWGRSTVGLARNEVSRRYVTETPEVWYPEAWREKADNVKQGSGDLLPEEVYKDVDNIYYGFAIMAIEEAYRDMLERGVCPEQARAVLPQSMMTEFIETGSLAAYARIYNLRTDPHAQKEIQEYAYAVGREIKKTCPVSWEALTAGCE